MTFLVLFDSSVTSDVIWQCILLNSLKIIEEEHIVLHGNGLVLVGGDMGIGLQFWTS